MNTHHPGLDGLAQQHLVRKLRAISECNHALVRAVDEPSLLNEICRIICDVAGYRMAWVGFAEHDQRKTVRPVAWGGAVDGYLDTVDIVWSDTERGRGPTGTCIRNRTLCYIDDYFTSPQTALWRESALRRGYRCNIALPLLDENGNAFGALMIYASRPGAFTPDEIQLLTELSDDLAFGIVSLRARAERKRAEAALAHSHDLMRYIIEHNRSAIAVHDRDLKYIFVSQRYLDEYNVKEKDVIGKHHYDVFPDLPQKWRDVHQRALAGEVSSAEDDPYVREDGSVEWTRWECRPWYEADGSIGGIIIYTEVITNRKRAEAALRESEQKFRSLFEQAGDYILILDPSLPNGPTIVDANEAACRKHGYTRDEFVGMSIRELDAALSESRSAEISRQLMTGAPLCFETTHRRKDGSIFPVEACVKLVRIGDRPPLIFTTERDITDRKHAEQEREKLQAQLIQAQKMESVGRLAGGVAHDFNNMLGVILGHAELALEQVESASPVHDDLREILKAAQHSADLTRQLLAFARKQTVCPRVLDLNETVAGIFKMLQRLIGENIKLLWQPGTDLWPVKMDPSQVDQILTNLAVNARDAIDGMGTITITTQNIVLDAPSCAAQEGIEPGEYIQLAVSDTGSGMDQETLQHLFEPFFTTKEVGQGTGLGLATVYGAVRQNNGFIDVRSRTGQGTTFTIFLPRTHSKIPVETRTVQRHSIRGTETVLLVEDEPAILNLVDDVLKKHGYTVLTAQAPSAALALAERHQGPIHLLLTDVVMPDMHGKDLWNRIATICPGIRALFISGYTSDVIAHQGILQPGIVFLQKPFSIGALVQKVQEALK